MVFQNGYDSIDPKTGEPHYRNDIVEQRMNEWVPGCPSTEGGHNWQAMSYYAPGNRIVAPLSQTCLDLAAQTVEKIEGGGSWRRSPAPLLGNARIERQHRQTRRLRCALS